MQIELTKGLYALIDEEDYQLVSELKWYADVRKVNAYAVRKTKKDGVLKMHRYILEKHGFDLTGKEVDHINCDGLDNRKENLRVCTVLENRRNQKLRYNMSTKGIYYHRQSQKWCARLKIENKRISLGYFYTKEEATAAYDEAAKKYFGDFAKTNKELNE